MNRLQEINKLEKQLEQKKKYLNGVSWHQVLIETDTEIEDHLVADELGEDINAWELYTSALRDGSKSTIIKLKDVRY